MRFGVIANPKKEKVWQVLRNLISWSERRGQDLIIARYLNQGLNDPGLKIKSMERGRIPENCEIVIAMGGDGTILSTARLVGPTQTPILGVNLGGLGFLAELSIEELFDKLDKILRNEYYIEERMVLRAVVKDGGTTLQFTALNDIVVDKGKSSRMINIRTFVDDEYLNTYTADGLIISTPTGSTAYSLAAGGPIIIPLLEALVVTPICPHSLTARPVVIPAEKVVKLSFITELGEIMLSADGQVENRMNPGAVVEVTKAPHVVRLVKWETRKFFDVLRAKLNWGQDFRS